MPVALVFDHPELHGLTATIYATRREAGYAHVDHPGDSEVRPVTHALDTEGHTVLMPSGHLFHVTRAVLINPTRVELYGRQWHETPTVIGWGQHYKRFVPNTDMVLMDEPGMVIAAEALITVFRGASDQATQ
jgi:hypothetical protein